MSEQALATSGIAATVVYRQRFTQGLRRSDKRLDPLSCSLRVCL